MPTKPGNKASSSAAHTTTKAVAAPRHNHNHNHVAAAAHISKKPATSISSVAKPKVVTANSSSKFSVPPIPRSMQPARGAPPRGSAGGTTTLRRDDSGRFYRANENGEPVQQQQQQGIGGAPEQAFVEGTMAPGTGPGFGRTATPNFGGGFSSSFRPSGGAYYPCTAPAMRLM